MVTILAPLSKIQVSSKWGLLLNTIPLFIFNLPSAFNMFQIFENNVTHHFLTYACDNSLYVGSWKMTCLLNSNLEGSDSGIWLSDIIFFFWTFSIIKIFNKARHSGSRLCICLHTRKAPNLVDPLDGAIPSHWATCLKTETEPASEMSCFIKRLVDRHKVQKKIMSAFVQVLEIHSCLHVCACTIKKGVQDTIRVCYNNLLLNIIHGITSKMLFIFFHFVEFYWHQSRWTFG